MFSSFVMNRYVADNNNNLLSVAGVHNYNGECFLGRCIKLISRAICNPLKKECVVRACIYYLLYILLLCLHYIHHSYSCHYADLAMYDLQSESCTGRANPVIT